MPGQFAGNRSAGPLSLSFGEEIVLLNAHGFPGLSPSFPPPCFSASTIPKVLHSLALCFLYQSSGPVVSSLLPSPQHHGLTRLIVPTYSSFPFPSLTMFSPSLEFRVSIFQYNVQASTRQGTSGLQDTESQNHISLGWKGPSISFSSNLPTMGFNATH